MSSLPDINSTEFTLSRLKSGPSLHGPTAYFQFTFISSHLVLGIYYCSSYQLYTHIWFHMFRRFQLLKQFEAIYIT
ncbi:hypothetical protein Ancab_024423 [Ancistrocladus abbreviatus]